MAITVETGTGQTTSGTALTPLAPDAGSYGYTVDDPGQAVMKNVVNALDQPNTVRCQVATVADVFKGSDVAAAAGQRTDGLSILVQITESWKVTDSVTGDVYYLPISAHMVLKIPVDANITGALLQALVTRLVGSLDRGAADVADSLTSLSHGVVRLPEYVAPTP